MRFINEAKYESPRNNEARKQFLKNKRNLMWNSDIAFDNPEEFDKNQKELIKAYNKEIPKRKIVKNLLSQKGITENKSNEFDTLLNNIVDEYQRLFPYDDLNTPYNTHAKYIKNLKSEFSSLNTVQSHIKDLETDINTIPEAKTLLSMLKQMETILDNDLSAKPVYLESDNFEDNLNEALGINNEALKQGNLEKAKQIQADIKFYEEKEDDQPYNSYEDKLNNLYQQLDESSNQLKDMAKHNKKKQKGKGWFVKLNAGNPEYNASFFNRAMGNDTISSSDTSNSEGTGLAEDLNIDKEHIEPRQINIRQSLVELDKEDPDFLGSLSSMYDYLEPDLTIEDKKELIDLINKHDHLKIFNFLNNKIDVDFDYEIHEEEID